MKKSIYYNSSLRRRRDHLNKDGLEKIIKLKNTMNRKCETTTV
jgi:hypothetical protein